MSTPANLVVRRTFLEYVGDDAEDDDQPTQGPRSRSEPSIPSFAETVDQTQRREKVDDESDHDPEVAAETEQCAAGPQNEVQSGEAKSEEQRAPSVEHEDPLTLNLLLHHMPETLDQDGDGSCRSSTSTRLLVKNTFLEVVEDEESDAHDANRRRAHTAPAESAEMGMMHTLSETSDLGDLMRMRKADSTPANRHRKGKGYPGFGDSPRSAAPAFFFTDEPEDVPSEREPITETSPIMPEEELPAAEVKLNASDPQPKRKMSTAEVSLPEEIPAPEVNVNATDPQAKRKTSTTSVSAIPTDAGSCSMSSGEMTCGGSASAGEGLEDGPKTTIMLRNLPVSFTRDMLLEVLDKEGFSGRYDFVYLPIDFGSRCGFGYAFINLVDTVAADDFRAHFQGFSNWGIESPKVADITWSSTHQGFEEHVSRYRNSPVMHETMPDECKPIVLRDGVRIDFPPPTKTLRPPRIRPSKNRGGRSVGSSDTSQSHAEAE